MRRRQSDFTLRQLDTFVSAARTGSFALAAGQLGISQPAVSDHIATLERHLGHKLFDRRRGTTPVLTRKGVEMLQRAEALLSSSSPMRGAERLRPTAAKVLIRILIGNRTRDTYLKPLMARAYTELPDVELEIVQALPPDRIGAALEKGEVDLLLTSIGRPVIRLPNVQLLSDVAIHLVAAPQIVAQLDAGNLAMEDLQFILPNVGAIAEHWLEGQLALAGIRPRQSVRYLEFTDVIQSIVEEGRGVSILAEEQIGPALAAGKLVRFGPELGPMRRIIARSPLAPPAAEVLERMLIREITSRPLPN